MKLSDLISCEAARNMFGKPTGNFIATGFNAEATAATKDAAVSNLLNEVGAIVGKHGQRRYAFSPDGRTVFVMYFQSGSWCYDIMDAERTTPCTVMCTSDFEDTLAYMQKHAAGYND